VNDNAGNERNMNRTLKAILLSAGLCSLPSLCFSAIVYDNPSSGSNPPQYFPTNAPTLEFGDQITLTTNNTTDRTLSLFQFEYFFSGATATTQSVTLRLYANTGVGSPPSPSTTPLFASDPIPLAPGYKTQPIDFSSAFPPITLPETFTWTVQFSNLAAGQTGGLLVGGPPNVGTSFNDFWQRDAAGAWSTMRIAGVPFNDFAARVTAVPEPGVLALGGLGALLLAGLGRFRKALR